MLNQLQRRRRRRRRRRGRRKLWWVAGSEEMGGAAKTAKAREIREKKIWVRCGRRTGETGFRDGRSHANV